MDEIRKWSPEKFSLYLNRFYERPVSSVKLADTQEELFELREYHQEQTEFFVQTQQTLLSYLNLFLPALEEPFLQNPLTRRWFPPLEDPLIRGLRMKLILTATLENLSEVVQALAPTASPQEARDLAIQIVLTRNLTQEEEH